MTGCAGNDTEQAASADVINIQIAYCVRSGIIDRSCQSGILIFVHLEKHAIQWDTVAKIVYNRYIKMQDMEVCT